MRKHIYIAYTGGTIGMKPSKQGYVPAAGFLSDTLKKMPEFHRSEMPLFTLHEYDNLIDSSDMDRLTGSVLPMISPTTTTSTMASLFYTVQTPWHTPPRR